MATATSESPMSSSSASTEIDPREAYRLFQSDEAILVDVREPDEHRQVHVAGSMLVPVGTLDVSRIRAAAGDRRVLIHCKSGRRAADAVARYNAATGTVAVNVVGGIEAWQKAGLPVVRDVKAPLPLMRQVQIVIGLFVAAFTALGAFVNPWFLVVPAFMGCGLLFAGITGFCGLATVLSMMPWNRVTGAPIATSCSTGSC